MILIRKKGGYILTYLPCGSRTSSIGGGCLEEFFILIANISTLALCFLLGKG